MALSKTTQDHDEIRRWAEERGAKPAVVASTEGDDQTGIIRLVFLGAPNAEDSAHEEISWDEWLDKFASSGLEFTYQEETAEGDRSNFNKLTYPENARRSSRSASDRSSAKKSSKTAIKKGPAKKGSRTAPVRAAAKKAAGKKAAGKKASKKSAAKRSSGRTATKKATAKRSAKKAAGKRPAGKKASAKKSASKRSTRR
jgi:hypothetical protein